MQNVPKESVAYSGKIGEVIHTQFPDGRIFERYRRAPGTRLIIVSNDNKILVTKEFRHENDSYDFRLPGGKVRDTLNEYRDLLSSKESLENAAREAAKKEAREETGLIVNDLELLTISRAGATVEWDLYYFLVKDYSDNDGQHLEHGEDIQITWLSMTELTDLILRGGMSEWRSVGVLLGLVFPILGSKSVH